MGEKIKAPENMMREKIKAARESVNPQSGCPTVCRSMGEKIKAPDEVLREKIKAARESVNP